MDEEAKNEEADEKWRREEREKKERDEERTRKNREKRLKKKGKGKGKGNGPVAENGNAAGLDAQGVKKKAALQIPRRASQDEDHGSDFGVAEIAKENGVTIHDDD